MTKIHMEDIVAAIEKAKRQPTVCRICDVMLLIANYTKPKSDSLRTATEIFRVKMLEDENASE